jgi:hypothetical protein
VTFIDSSGFKEFLEAKSGAQINGHRLLMLEPACKRGGPPLLLLPLLDFHSACHVDQ